MLYAGKLTEAVNAIQDADKDRLTDKNPRPLLRLCNSITNTAQRLAGLVNVRETALTSFDWFLSSTEQEEMRLKATELRLKRIIRKLISHSTQIARYGSAAVEIEFILDNLNGRVPIVKRILEPYDLCKFKYELYQYKYDNDGAQTNTVERIDDNPEIITGTNFKTFDGGYSRTILIPQIQLFMNIEEWQHTNKMLKGIVYGSMDAEKLAQAKIQLNLSDAQILNLIQTLETSIQQAGDKQGITTLSAADIQLKSLAISGAHSSFSDFQKELKADISIDIIGQADITQLSSTGSYAAMKVQDLIRKDILYYDMNIAKAFIQQLLDVDFRENYDTNSSSPFSLEFVFDEDSDIDTKINVYDSAIRNGVPVSKKQYYKEMRLTEPITADDTLTVRDDL